MGLAGDVAAGLDAVDENIVAGARRLFRQVFGVFGEIIDAGERGFGVERRRSRAFEPARHGFEILKQALGQRHHRFAGGDQAFVGALGEVVINPERAPRLFQPALQRQQEIRADRR